MITRTITSTQCTVLALNTETCEPFNTSVILSKPTTDTKKALKEAKKKLDTDTVSVAKVVSLDPIEKKYGMDLDLFIQYAHELTPAEEAEAETEPAPATEA